MTKCVSVTIWILTRFEKLTISCPRFRLRKVRFRAHRVRFYFGQAKIMCVSARMQSGYVIAVFMNAYKLHFTLSIFLLSLLFLQNQCCIIIFANL